MIGHSFSMYLWLTIQILMMSKRRILNTLLGIKIKYKIVKHWLWTIFWIFIRKWWDKKKIDALCNRKRIIRYRSWTLVLMQFCWYDLFAVLLDISRQTFFATVSKPLREIWKSWLRTSLHYTLHCFLKLTVRGSWRNPLCCLTSVLYHS